MELVQCTVVGPNISICTEVMIKMLPIDPLFIKYRSFKDKDKDPFIGPEEFVMGYSKAPEQPRSNARPTVICQSHAMTRTGREPTTIHITAYWSSPYHTCLYVQN